jgi:antitoxin (DNA-binding transcriptional repressor) of toxin-antitoxin stability system/DNA-binding transcriptional regulator YiaG
MQHISKPQLSAQKALIRACMEAGVGIEFLDDHAPAFRLVPPPETERDREAKAEHAKPSKRATAKVKCANRACPCHKSKWFKHRHIEQGADYRTPMAGDDAALTKARKAYNDGNPVPLRAYLADTAGERAAAWAAIDLARLAPIPAPAKAVTMTSTDMTAAEFKSVEDALELTPQTIAPLLGVGWRTAYRYESGTTPIPATVAKLARILMAAHNGKADAAVAALVAGKL